MASIQELSSKRVKISRSTSMIVGSVAFASFIAVFSLIASRALIIQRSYQAKVIAEKEKTKKTLKDNLQATKVLKDKHKQFTENQTNLIGGSKSGNGLRDGDNDRLVLDALPSKYDYPALITSIEALISNPAYRETRITGTDNEVSQSANGSSASPTAIDMPFDISLKTSYLNSKILFENLDLSIRPIKILSIDITASKDKTGLDANMLTFDIKASTSYQPSKRLEIKSKVVQ